MGARDPSLLPCARAVVGFHTPQTKSTVSARSGLRERDASESMEVLSPLTIGSNALRARVQGTEERVVADLATASAGCTSATKARHLRPDGL
jgi:hypothetical protein